MKKLSAVTLAVFLGVVVLGAGWKEFFHDQVFPKRFGVVEEGRIYRSGQLHPNIVDDVLTDHEIRVVIDLQYFEEKPEILAEKATIESLGLTQHRFGLNGDGTGNLESYVGAIKAIEAAVGSGDPVLVHCAAGTQRTGGVLAAYRTLVQGKAASGVVEEMTRYDWDPEDDTAVLTYLDENLPELARRLVEEGVIPAVPGDLPRFREAARQL